MTNANRLNSWDLPCNLYFKFLSNPNVLGRKRASDYNKKNKCESAIHEKRRLWPVFCDGEAIPYRGIIEADEAALLQKRVQTRSRIVNTRCSKVCCSFIGLEPGRSKRDSNLFSQAASRLSSHAGVTVRAPEVTEVLKI